MLGIGDAIRTDVKAAALAGVDSLFVAGGLHRDEFIVDDAIDAVRLGKALAADSVKPVAVMTALVW